MVRDFAETRIGPIAEEIDREHRFPYEIVEEMAALGLMVVMVLAVAWHLQRGEVQNVPGNLLFASLLAFVAYGRLRLRPLGE